MNTRSGKRIVGMVALLVACSVVGFSPGLAFGERPSLDGENDISAASGAFTGALYGVITIGDRQVLINDRTTLYRPGHGAVALHAFVVNSKVYATGPVRDGLLIARIVMLSREAPSLDVRPLTDANLNPDPENVPK